MMKEEKKKQTVWLAYRSLDEGADVLGVFTSEEDAYHCIDCEGGDYVEQAEVQTGYDNDHGRIYRMTLADGQGYDDIKAKIRTEDVTGFDGRDVTQAVMWDETDDGRARISAKVRSVNRLAAFSLVRQLLGERSEDFPHVAGQWYEYPTMRELHPRKLTAFERNIYECMMMGSEQDRQFDGFHSIVTKDQQP